MTINSKKMKLFIEKFESDIFPKIKGEDGEGIEKFKRIIEEKRKQLAERQKL